MGQYPSPYSPPPYSGGQGYPSPMPDLLAPARRASIMLVVVGALMLLFGTCVGSIILTHTDADLQEAIDKNPFGKQFPPPQGVPVVKLARTFYTSASIGGLVFGLSFVVLGLMVRRAGRISMVLAVVVCFSFISVELISVLIGCGGGSVILSGTACTGFLPAIPICIASAWLLQMLKALPHIEATRQQWQAYNAASQQQQQSYGQGSYDYLAAPPVVYPQPPAGAPPIGYGALPPAVPGESDAPPVRHPPLPPDHEKNMKDKG